jgi:predicted ATPase
MNPDQTRIFDSILERVEDPNGALFFVDGRAGRGKTFLMSAICDRIRGDGGIVCVVGTTALSVIHYERGRTAHSAFGIPVQQNDEGLESRIGRGSAHAQLLRQANLIIWEEMPMVKKVVWECVDQLLRDVMGNEPSFR